MGFVVYTRYNEAIKSKGERSMKNKKLMALLLSGTLCVSVLAGCGDSNSGSQASGSGTNSDKASTTEGNGGESSNGESNGSGEVDLYGFEEPVTIKVGYNWGPEFEFLGGETSTDNQWANLYKEHNIFIDVLYEVDSSQGETKLTQAIISQNYPDILGPSISDYVNYAQTDVIADITDIFEQYASDELKEYVNADGGISLSSITIDGRIYGIPHMGNSYDSVPVMYIRQDWLDNLGLQVPETMEELKAVAYAFSHNDPDQNGVDDTYGLAINGVNVLVNSGGDLSAFFSGFGAHLGTSGMAFVRNEDGAVTWGGTNTEGMKAALTMLRDMYNDGSLAKDFITNSNTDEDINAGKCGIWFGPMWACMGYPQMLKNDLNARITAAPTPDGLNQGGSKTLVSSAMDSVYCVSSQCEHPEVLIKLMNLSVQKLCHPESDDEYYRYYGNADQYSGFKTCLTPSLIPLKNLDNFRLESAALESGSMDGLNAEQKSDVTYMSAFLEAYQSDSFSAESLDIPEVSAGGGLYPVFGSPKGSYAAINQMIQSDAFIPSAYNFVPTENMADNAATLKKLTVETIIKIITGSEPVDYYDSFLDNWYAIGGEDCIADAQAWADSQ